MYPKLTNPQIYKQDIDHSRVHGILMGCKLTLRCVLNSPEMESIKAAQRLEKELSHVFRRTVLACAKAKGNQHIRTHHRSSRNHSNPVLNAASAV
jgi:hypothetical protein